MTTLAEYGTAPQRIRLTVEHEGLERREYRRVDMQQRDITVERWDGSRRIPRPFGKLVDLSAGGIRIRTSTLNIRPDHQIRVRLQLPAYAGVCPFVDTSGDLPQPKSDWIGWLTVTRVEQVNDREFDVAGRLMDMDEMNRGMLALYISTQPLAA